MVVKVFDISEDSRFDEAVNLFNLYDWYAAHDLFEELWHETHGPSRATIQGILQVAVAQLHLENGNISGAVILYGEGLGRLMTLGRPDLGLNIDDFCEQIKIRLAFFQKLTDQNADHLPQLRLEKLT